MQEASSALGFIFFSVSNSLYKHLFSFFFISVVSDFQQSK